jgi:hypothetical protein
MSRTAAAANVPLVFNTPSKMHQNELFEPAPTVSEAADGAVMSPAATATQQAVALSPEAARWAAMPPPVWGEPKAAPAADDVVLPPSPTQQLMVCVVHVVVPQHSSCIRSHC